LVVIKLFEVLLDNILLSHCHGIFSVTVMVCRSQVKSYIHNIVF